MRPSSSSSSLFLCPSQLPFPLPLSFPLSLSFPLPLSAFPCHPLSYLALPLPVSTLRAVARSGGVAVAAILSSSPSSSLHRRPLVPHRPLPVVLLVSLSPRPPSSGGGGSTPVPLSHRRRPSTHDPPHEQLLMRLGVSGGPFVVGPCCCHCRDRRGRPLRRLVLHPRVRHHSQ